jgi:hypothetical protein
MFLGTMTLSLKVLRRFKPQRLEEVPAEHARRHPLQIEIVESLRISGVSIPSMMAPMLDGEAAEIDAADRPKKGAQQRVQRPAFEQRVVRAVVHHDRHAIYEQTDERHE